MWFFFGELRRSDSNEWPLGYEPNELPTAPLRDVFVLRLQRYDFILILQIIWVLFFILFSHYSVSAW